MPDPTPCPPGFAPDPTTGECLPIVGGISVNVNGVADHEIDPKQRAKLETLGQKEAGSSFDLWSGFWAGIMDGAAAIISTAVFLVDKVYVLAGKFFHAAQGEQNPEMWELAATIISDLTGVEVDAEALKKARFGSGRLAGMDALGKNLFNLLESEFVTQRDTETSGTAPIRDGSGIGGLPADKLTPEQGIVAARRFLGFVSSFAIRQGNVATIAEFIPEEANFLKGFREYGEMMAKNLGLGRLTRLALRPLMTTLVADPLTWGLNKQYRPTLLSPKSAVRAWLSQHMTVDEMKEELALQGFSEAKIAATIQETLRELTLPQINVLRAFGFLNDSDTKLFLKRAGYDEEVADFVIKAEDRLEVQHASRTIAGKLVNDFLAGIISSDEMTQSFSRLALTDPEKAGLQGLAGELGQLPRRTLTLTQMREAYIHGTIDLLEFEDYLTRVGYRSDDRKILTIELLLDARADAQQQALAAERAAEREARRAAAAAKAAGVLPPP
jgi:hypothetical protein